MTPPFHPCEALTKRHYVAEFDCGSEAQTSWLQRHALQSQSAGMSRVFVVCRTTDDHVAGYYALSTGSVRNSDATPRLVQGTARYDIPVIVLARLGVDRASQSLGVGRALVVDAFRRVDRIAEQVGVRGVLIHAENEQAKSFYLRLATFETSGLNSFQLILLIKDLRKAINRS